MTAWAFIGLAVLILVALMADDKGGDDDEGGDEDKGGAGDDDKGGEQQPAIKEGMSVEQVQELLRKEGDRLDMKYKGQLEKALADAKAGWEQEQKEAAERAEMSELEKVKADLEKANAEAEAARQEAELQQKRTALQDWIATNAPPELPIAYRRMIEGEDDEARAESLKTVSEQYTKDFQARTGEKPKLSVGGPTAPGAQPGEDEKGEDTGQLSPYQKLMKEADEEAQAASTGGA